MIKRILCSLAENSRGYFQITVATAILWVLFPIASFANPLFFEDFVPVGKQDRSPTQGQQYIATTLVHKIFQELSITERQSAMYSLAKFVDVDSDSYIVKSYITRDQRRQAVKIALISQLSTALQSSKTAKLIPALDILAYDFLTEGSTKKSGLSKITESLKQSIGISPKLGNHAQLLESTFYSLHIAIRQSLEGAGINATANGLSHYLAQLRSSDPVIHERLMDIIENERMTTEIRVAAVQALRQNAPSHGRLYRRLSRFIKAHIDGQKNIRLVNNKDLLIALEKAVDSYAVSRPTHNIMRERTAQLARIAIAMANSLSSYNNRSCQKAFGPAYGD